MDEAPLKKRRIIATTIGIVVGFVGILAACEVGRLCQAQQHSKPRPWFDEEEVENHPVLKVLRIVYSQNPARCVSKFRVSPSQFEKLCDVLEQSQLPTTDLLQCELQLAVFLDWLGTGKTVREQKELWTISLESIIICRRQITRALLGSLYPVYVTQPVECPRINNPKFRHFQGAIGCIDGTHIPIVPPTLDQLRWKNRKSYYSTNVLAVCDCSESLLFQFVLCGAEGCGSDSTIFGKAKRMMRWLGGSFLLGDAGYGLSHFILTPYRGVRYHLQEQGPQDSRPKCFKELFNLRHAQMRNCIERCFGVLKKRFQLLEKPIDMDDSNLLWSVLYVSFALHNFIRITDAGVDAEWERLVTDELAAFGRAHPNAVAGQYDDPIPRAELIGERDSRAKRWRDHIAHLMWHDYVAVVRARRLPHPTIPID